MARKHDVHHVVHDYGALIDGQNIKDGDLNAHV